MYYQKSNPNIIDELIDGEVIIVNFVSGTYYSLLGSASTIWEYLIKGHSLDDVVTILQHKYLVEPTEVHDTVVTFIQQLKDASLVSESPTPSSNVQLSQDFENDSKQPFLAPVIESFSDMAELLLLDPIHQVDQTGWPLKADGTA